MHILPFNVKGRQFIGLFLTTYEATWADGSTRNPTKSFCDPYVFNTVISRAQSLVVAVGNPFDLLRMEGHATGSCGDRASCWSAYLKTCLDHKTLYVDSSLSLSPAEEKECIEKLKQRLISVSLESEYQWSLIPLPVTYSPVSVYMFGL